MKLELTDRDTEVLDFFSKGLIADTLLINQMFFGNLRSCERRLLKYFRNHLIHRKQLAFQQPYTYYRGTFPKDMIHRKLISQLFAQLKIQGAEILYYQPFYSLSNLKVDLLILIKWKNKKTLLICDVNSQKTFNPKGYEDLLSKQSHVVKEALKELPSFHQIQIIACAPKNASSRLNHYYIPSSLIAEKIPDLLHYLETKKAPVSK